MLISDNFMEKITLTDYQKVIEKRKGSFKL